MLTDKGLEVWRRFGVRMDGDKPVKRITFVIGKGGIVRLVYFYTGRGDPADHAPAALDAVKNLAD